MTPEIIREARLDPGPVPQPKTGEAAKVNWLLQSMKDRLAQRRVAALVTHTKGHVVVVKRLVGESIEKRQKTAIELRLWAKGPTQQQHADFYVCRIRYVGLYFCQTYQQFASAHKARPDIDGLFCEKKGTYLIVYRQRIGPNTCILCIYTGSAHCQTIGERCRQHEARFRAVAKAEAKKDEDAISAAQGKQRNLYRTGIVDPPLFFAWTSTSPPPNSALSHMSPPSYCSSSSAASQTDSTSTALVVDALPPTTARGWSLLRYHPRFDLQSTDHDVEVGVAACTECG